MSHATSDVLDSLDMFGHAARFPELVAEAAEVAAGIEGLPAADEVDNVLVLGMGVGGLAGDLLVAVGGPFVPVPLVVAKGYGLPSFVGPGTLCFAVSFSGDTEETVEAAQAAASAGARLVVVARGGALGALAPRWQAPHVRVPTELPMSRLGLGSLAVPMILLLEQIGLFPGASGWVDAAVMQLEVRRDALVAGESAQRIARTIGRTIPLLLGAGPLGAVAARRWKTQINENAKSAAVAEELPEAMHNAVVGYDQPDVLRDHQYHVFLSSSSDHERNAFRADLSIELLNQVGISHQTVLIEGEGRFAQACAAITLGDYVSAYLGLLYGQDPSSTPVLTHVKERMAEFGQDD